MQNDLENPLDDRRDAVPDHEIDLDWAKTRSHLRADFERLTSMIDDRGTLAKRLYWLFLPQFQVLIWYRVSRLAHLSGWSRLARYIHLTSLYLTAAELPPTASIGPGCFIGHAPGVRINGRVGSRFTVFAEAGISGAEGDADIGAGPGLPIVGDNVTLSVKAVILGPIHVGHSAKLGPGVIVTRDIPARASLFNPQPRMIFWSAAPASNPAS